MIRMGPFPSSRDELMTALTDRILDGEYPIGSKLPSEREVALSSGLSRPIVREVLRGLQERGLIEIQAGRGAFVRERASMNVARTIDTFVRTEGATARHLVEVRAMLERTACQMACERATEQDIATLGGLSQAFDRARDVIERARCDVAFHAMIEKSAHNPVMETLFGTIAPLIFELQLRSLDDPRILDAGAPLHHTVLEGIRRRDAVAAGEAMWRHVTLANEMFGADLDLSLDLVARRKISTLLGQNTTLEDVIAEVLGGPAHSILPY